MLIFIVPLLNIICMFKPHLQKSNFQLASCKWNPCS